AQLAVQLDAMSAAAEAGLKDHDRWLTAKNLLARKLTGRRATSKLPALLDADPADRLGRHDRGRTRDHAPGRTRPRRSSACARRPDVDAIGPGASCSARQSVRAPAAQQMAIAVLSHPAGAGEM